MNSDDTTPDDPTPEQIEEWQAEAAAVATGEPAKKSPFTAEQLARAKVGRERFWAARRAAKAAGQSPPEPKRRRHAPRAEPVPVAAPPPPPHGAGGGGRDAALVCL